MESKVIQISKKIQREDEVMTKQKAKPLIPPDSTIGVHNPISQSSTKCGSRFFKCKMWRNFLEGKSVENDV